jgi:hypothetical protein
LFPHHSPYNGFSCRQITQLQESKYTVPLSAVQQQLEDASKEAQALVLFMQDEFSHFDFSRFRGADGAAFEQLEVRAVYHGRSSN